MIKISGQLVIQKKNGRFGEFSVGYLNCSLGDFSVKAAGLDQYPEGKYDGDFCISRITLESYTTRSGSVIFEMRAKVDSMTLSGIDKLSTEDAKRLVHQEPDPIDEETKQVIAVVSEDPLKDTTQFSDDKESKSKKSKSTPSKEEDERLFGILWPLGERVKLDATVERLCLRKQSARLEKLGYTFDPLKQEWLKTVA